MVEESFLCSVFFENRKLFLLVKKNCLKIVSGCVEINKKHSRIQSIFKGLFSFALNCGTWMLSKYYRGHVIYQRKKWNKAFGFCFGTAMVFLVAASKTDVASKTESLPFGFLVLPFGFIVLYKPSVFTLLQYYPSVFSYRRFSGVWF